MKTIVFEFVEHQLVIRMQHFLNYDFFFWGLLLLYLGCGQRCRRKGRFSRWKTSLRSGNRSVLFSCLQILLIRGGKVNLLFGLHEISYNVNYYVI